MRVGSAVGRVAAGVALLGLALAGCGRESADPEPAPEQTSGDQTGRDENGGNETGGDQTTGDQTDGDQTTGDEPDADEPARLSGPVALSISGGFAGVNEGIEVDPDGDVRVHDGDDPRPAAALTEAELTELAEALARVDFDQLPAASIDDQAADMFHYLFDYDGRSLLTDGSEELGPVDDAIGLLGGHLDDRRTTD
ncbi:hypothetical protein [Streptomyces sp. B6B3]|uniref:hypothetical protein n=1 Tax=Streptomyces sp. B6B3 TaxID=3153570 RepID=UPI00325F8F41